MAYWASSYRLPPSLSSSEDMLCELPLNRIGEARAAMTFLSPKFKFSTVEGPESALNRPPREMKFFKSANTSRASASSRLVHNNAALHEQEQDHSAECEELVVTSTFGAPPASNLSPHSEESNEQSDDASENKAERAILEADDLLAPPPKNERSRMSAHADISSLPSIYSPPSHSANHYVSHAARTDISDSSEDGEETRHAADVMRFGKNFSAASALVYLTLSLCLSLSLCMYTEVCVCVCVCACVCVHIQSVVW